MQEGKPAFFRHEGKGRTVTPEKALSEMDKSCCALIRAGHTNLLTYPYSFYLSAIDELTNG